MTTLNKTLFLLLLILIGITGCSSRVYAPEGSTTTVVLIRHTERTMITKVLNEEGKIRAAALPAAVKDLDITAIYSPDLVRNIDTVKPLAQERGLEIILVEAKPDTAIISERLLSDFPGKTVLWVGNTTNLGAIFWDLGGEGEPPNDYGDLFILKVPDSGSTELEKRYFGP